MNEQHGRRNLRRRQSWRRAPRRWSYDAREAFMETARSNFAVSWEDSWRDGPFDRGRARAQPQSAAISDSLRRLPRMLRTAHWRASSDACAHRRRLACAAPAITLLASPVPPRCAPSSCHRGCGIARAIRSTGADPLRCARQRIVPQVPWELFRRWIGPAVFEMQHQAASPGDGFDNADGQTEMLEHRDLARCGIRGIQTHCPGN